MVDEFEGAADDCKIMQDCIAKQDGAIRQDIVVKFAAPMEDDLKGGVDDRRIVVDIIKREAVFMKDDCRIGRGVVMKASMLRRNEDEDEAPGGLALIVPIFDTVQPSDAVSYKMLIRLQYHRDPAIARAILYMSFDNAQDKWYYLLDMVKYLVTQK